MPRYLDSDDLPFTAEELRAALRAAGRADAEARGRVAEWAALAAERRPRATGEDGGGDAADPYDVPVDVLATLAVASPDAAARVCRVRAGRVPPGAPAALRAEENRFWHEALAAARARQDDAPPVT